MNGPGTSSSSTILSRYPFRRTRASPHSLAQLRSVLPLSALPDVELSPSSSHLVFPTSFSLAISRSLHVLSSVCSPRSVHETTRPSPSARLSSTVITLSLLRFVSSENKFPTLLGSLTQARVAHAKKN